MLRSYCPACRLLFFARGPEVAPGKCPRCDARVPTTRAVEENAWLASTVIAELRASRGEQRRARRA